MTIKIAIIGTNGSGKTTLIEKIEKELRIRKQMIEVVHEVASQSPWTINEQADFMSQRWIYLQQLLKETEAKYKNPDIILCDRCLIDNICYFERLNESSTPFPIIEFLQLHEIARLWSQDYDQVIFMPFKASQIVDNGVRSTNINFAKDIDRRINIKLKEFKINNVIRYKKNFSVSRFCDKILPKRKRATK